MSASRDSEAPERTPLRTRVSRYSENARNGWSIFTDWHKEPSLWREIYARTASALIAVAIVYGAGAAAGSFSRKPLAIIGVPLQILGVVLLLMAARSAWLTFTRKRSDDSDPHDDSDPGRDMAIRGFLGVVALFMGSGLTFGSTQ
jgi:hypothetical protein